MKKEDRKIIPFTPGRIQPSGPKLNWAPGVKATVQKPEVDVDYVVDTTGSMTLIIQAILNSIEDNVTESARLNLDIRFQLVSFGDISFQGSTDRIELVVPLTSNIERVKDGLRNIPRNNGYSNTGESSFEAAYFSVNQPHRPNAVKVMVLITDEPALKHKVTYKELDKLLFTKEYLVYAISIRDTDYISLSRNHGGEWEEIGFGSSMSQLLDLFKRLATKIAKTVDKVHKLSGGSVNKFLLGPGSKK